MTVCKYDPDLGYRVLARDGEPCTRGHCCVGSCWRHTDDQHPQTCAECVGLLRDHLAAIVDMHERLEEQVCHTHADGRLNTGPLGGDAMVMLAEGRYLSVARIGPDEQPGDPLPPLLVLAGWEDDWRIDLGHGGGPRATVWGAADYLGQHLTLMAQRHPAFDEFAADLARVRGRLEDVLDEGERDEKGAPCMDCGSLLVRRCDPRHGLLDEWRCLRCHVTYTAAEYWNAVKRDYQDNASALHADALEKRTGVPIATVRVWVNRGKVRRRGVDEAGRALYDVADVERHAGDEGLAAS